MKPGMTLYIRNDRRISNDEIEAHVFDDHLKYLFELSKTRTVVGGGYVNEPGGMVVFEASDLNEAREITKKDPIIHAGYFDYDLKEWELVIVSKGE
ncbi:MAG: hypothetical protein JEZ08_24045 [Clostridiales bacterium]|nr:hypothetical protein [Clostridiales bacterium]